MITENIDAETARLRSLPWYRHGWVWFIIFLPSSVVVASFITLYIAIVNAPEHVEAKHIHAKTRQAVSEYNGSQSDND